MRAPRQADSIATTLDLTDKTGDTSDWSKRALGPHNVLGPCVDDADLASTVTVRCTLVCEPELGGLLERVQIVDDANVTFRSFVIRTLRARTSAECRRRAVHRQS